MTTDQNAPAPAPNPAAVSPLALSKRLVRRVEEPTGPVRQLECLACERITSHALGPATYDKDGILLVQWWTCLECREGRTVG